MTTFKSIVSVLAILQLDGNNHDSWHHTLKYLSNKNDILDFITIEIVPLSGTNATEAKRYAEEVKKDHSA